MAQQQFTIELRVDYVDRDKNEVMKTALLHAARHLFAQASLISDSGMKPDIAIHSDNFFCGRQELNLMEDIIGKGLEETGQTGLSSTIAGDAGTISSELMLAARDSKNV